MFCEKKLLVLLSVTVHLLCDNECVCVLNCVVHLPEAPGEFLLTKKGGRGDGSVATGDHDTDARLNEGHREVNDL